MTPTQCICEKPYIAVGTEHCANCGGYPTEDTPTHDPQQDNLPPFHFRCQQGKVHSIEEGCDCKQDDKQLFTCDSCGLPNSATYGDGKLWGLCGNCYTLHGTVVSKLAFRSNAAQIQLVSELEKQGGYAHAEALKTGSNQVATLNAKIEELQQLLEGDRTLGGSLLRVPDHPDDVRVVDVSSEWLADEMNYRPRRAIREWIETRIARYQEQVNDLITTGSSQDTVTPSRPGEHKKQELERQNNAN